MIEITVNKPGEQKPSETSNPPVGSRGGLKIDDAKIEIIKAPKREGSKES